MLCQDKDFNISLNYIILTTESSWFSFGSGGESDEVVQSLALEKNKTFKRPAFKEDASLEVEYVQIDDTDEPLKQFKDIMIKNNVHYKDYPEYNLILLFTKYKQNTNSELVKECRSIVLDRNTFEIVAVILLSR